MKRKNSTETKNPLNLINSKLDRYLHDINIAFDSILANKLKSVLTALGIIFGVAAVISMLAIGKGAQEEILRQIKMVGVNNIIITPVLDEDEASQSGNDEKLKQKYSPGLNLLDVIAIKSILPTVKEISPEISEDSYVIQKGKRKSARLVGVTPFYFEIFGHQIGEGELFNNYHNTYGKQVCVISDGLKQKLFNNENPIGKLIKCGKNWLQIIGVLQKRYLAENTENLHLNTSNEIIYIPLNTMLMRYKNRALITSSKIRQANNNNNGDEEGTEKEKKAVNYHQLDKIVVQVKETEFLIPTVEVIQHMLMRRHLEVSDFEITVPELLLKQQQKTKDIFNIVLGAIAGISLVVGGIGIMNIMLASVMERIKEIGTRMAIGARKSDIIVQFLAESTMISFIGGLIGVVLGVVISKLITQFFNILTIVSPFSVLIAFGVSVTIGIAFGYMPAKKAADRDPVESLRHE